VLPPPPPPPPPTLLPAFRVVDEEDDNDEDDWGTRLRSGPLEEGVCGGVWYSGGSPSGGASFPLALVAEM
jgi:hypothetical protein